MGTLCCRMQDIKVNSPIFLTANDGNSVMLLSFPPEMYMLCAKCGFTPSADFVAQSVDLRFAQAIRG